MERIVEAELHDRTPDPGYGTASSRQARAACSSCCVGGLDVAEPLPGRIQSMAGGRFVVCHESAAVAQQSPACSDMFTVADGNWPITVIHGSMRAEAGVPATVETHPSNLMRVMPP